MANEYLLPADGQNVAMDIGPSSPSTQRMVTANNSPEIASLAAINTKTPALGQAVAALSVPVVLASDVPLAVAGLDEADRSDQYTVITSSLTETPIVTAGAAGVKNGLYSLHITNTSATAVNVTIRKSLAGPIFAVYSIQPGVTFGFVFHPDAFVKQPAAASAWTAQCSASVASVHITALTTQYA